MNARILYEDNTSAMTTEDVVLHGFTKVLGRARRIPLTGITSFRVRESTAFPNGQLPKWGTTDDGAWYTRDRRRFRRHAAIELTLSNHQVIGFTPAHAARFRELLLHHEVTER